MKTKPERGIELPKNKKTFSNLVKIARGDPEYLSDQCLRLLTLKIIAQAAADARNTRIYRDEAESWLSEVGRFWLVALRIDREIPGEDKDRVCELLLGTAENVQQTMDLEIELSIEEEVSVPEAYYKIQRRIRKRIREQQRREMENDQV